MSTNLSKSQNSTKACRIISSMAKSPIISTLSPPLKNRISPISSQAKNPMKLYSSSTETRPSKTISSVPRCYGKQGAIRTVRDMTRPKFHFGICAGSCACQIPGECRAHLTKMPF
ncbi:hypothetical protein ACE6H2_002343 [Prunus campanulata]